MKAWRDHVEALGREHGITVRRLAPAEKNVKAYTGVVLVRGINTQINYFEALHELGHVVLGHSGGRMAANCLEKEAEAWEWAVTHAIVPPSVRTRRDIGNCLRRYRDHGEKHGDRYSQPRKGHPYWRMVQW